MSLTDIINSLMLFQTKEDIMQKLEQSEKQMEFNRSTWRVADLHYKSVIRQSEERKKSIREERAKEKRGSERYKELGLYKASILQEREEAREDALAYKAKYKKSQDDYEVYKALYAAVLACEKMSLIGRDQ